MKIKIFFIVFLIFTIALFASSNIDYFRVTSVGKNIQLEWRTSDETNITRYEIERSSSVSPNFRQITTIDAKGYPSTYKYLDEEAYLKKPDDSDQTLAKQTFNYRIKIVKADNSFTYSSTESVTQEVSSIRRTWGMIKQMFR